MIISAEAVVGANTTNVTRVAAITATRAIVAYGTFVSLVEVAGSVLTTLQSDVTAIVTAVPTMRIVPTSPTTALLCRVTTTTANLALITMSGNTISAGATSTGIAVVSGAEMSIAPTTSTTGVLLSSQTANLSIYTYSIAGTAVTPSAVINGTITTSGTNISGAGIVSAVQPYVGTPVTSANSMLVYRDNITAAGSTNFFKLQKYLRA
jgi:hypothetical protein